MATILEKNLTDGTLHDTFDATTRSPARFTAFSTLCGVKWGWAVRGLEDQKPYGLDAATRQPPRAGDAVLVEVEKIGHHTRLMTAQHGRLRLYPGDRLVTVLGNRYATDAFEATLGDVETLQMLTDAGMVGTVRSKHQKMGVPTGVRFVGYLTDAQGHRVNLKTCQFHPQTQTGVPKNTIVVVGSGMNSGKTTTAARLVRSLLGRGVRVSACKLTGSVSYRDLSELRSTGAHDVRDFSCYGFPSTYLAAKHELVGLFHTMVSDANRCDPDVVVMEIADGMLQRETAILLEETGIRQSLMGVLLAATCAPSALFSVGHLERLGHELIGVSGLITSSPLFVDEFTRHCQAAVASSAGNGEPLADLVLRHRGLARRPLGGLKRRLGARRLPADSPPNARRQRAA
ncbi:MAG: hypothetical protein ACC645_16360 [Pirellulales bacterium]